MQDVLKVLKLSNGDDIIGFLQDGSSKTSADDEITLNHMIFIKGPMLIMAKYDETIKSHALFLVDWMPCASSTILPIPKDKIITMDAPNEKVEEHYMSIMGNKFIDEDITDEEHQQLEMYELLMNHRFDDEEDPN